MNISLKPSEIKGTVSAPASKSVAQRAIIAAMLSRGITYLHNLTLCDDTIAALQIIEQLGCHIDRNERHYTITSDTEKRVDFSGKLNCSESGLLTRMITPIVSLSSKNIEITGHGSLLKRPITGIKSPLQKMGVTFISENEFVPFTVKGPLKGGHITLDGSSSSQYLTGMLMSLPLCTQDSTLTVKNLKSKPYIDLTIELLAKFCIEIINENYHTFHIKGNQKYNPANLSIEGDWSGASCLLVAGAIGGEVKIDNLNSHSHQADKAIINALEKAGIQPTIFQNSISVKKNTINSFNFDATDCPDLFPALAVLAACANGTSVIKGAVRLKHKESNRAITLQKEFLKMGISIELKDDLFTIHGGKPNASCVDAHNDHRIAMALAALSIVADGITTIENAEAVSKSYPEFWQDLQTLIS